MLNGVSTLKMQDNSHCNLILGRVFLKIYDTCDERTGILRGWVNMF